MRLETLAIALCVPVLLVGCRKDDEATPDVALTYSEAQVAIEEVSLTGEADSIASGTIEIATTFTIGAAVETAAQELRDFVNSQLPCAEVSLSGSTLSVEYGVNPGNCTYRGHTYSGTHSISIDKNGPGEVMVHHEWASLSNGTLSVTGTADVTWSAAASSRHVVHDVTWTRLSDGRTGEGTGDRTQTPLAGGLSEGIAVDGARTWVSGGGGLWDLAIQDVEMRWADPVPESGAYVLATPQGKSLTMSFARKDDDTISVTLTSGERSFTIDVTRAGGGAS